MARCQFVQHSRSVAAQSVSPPVLPLAGTPPCPRLPRSGTSLLHVLGPLAALPVWVWVPKVRILEFDMNKPVKMDVGEQGMVTDLSSLYH